MPRIAFDADAAQAARRYLRLHAALMLAAAIALAVLLACVLLGDALQLLPPRRLLPFGLVLLGGVVALLPVALKLARQVRCPQCGMHCFIERRLTTGGPLDAADSGVLSQRFGTAQLRMQRCACMHCGAAIQWDADGA